HERIARRNLTDDRQLHADLLPRDAVMSSDGQTELQPERPALFRVNAQLRISITNQAQADQWGVTFATGEGAVNRWTVQVTEINRRYVQVRHDSAGRVEVRVTAIDVDTNDDGVVTGFTRRTSVQTFSAVDSQTASFRSIRVDGNLISETIVAAGQTILINHFVPEWMV
ncbi:MAG: hypothetical protein FWE31_05765, partial [Firmicutes bacterium]|nr:hypothetical protein [Bacillota bacterium]